MNSFIIIIVKREMILKTTYIERLFIYSFWPLLGCARILRRLTIFTKVIQLFQKRHVLNAHSAYSFLTAAHWPSRATPAHRAHHRSPKSGTRSYPLLSMLVLSEHSVSTAFTSALWASRYRPARDLPNRLRSRFCARHRRNGALLIRAINHTSYEGAPSGSHAINQTSYEGDLDSCHKQNS